MERIKKPERTSGRQRGARTSTVRVRLTPEEYDAMKTHADRFGLPIGVWMRMLALQRIRDVGGDILNAVP